MRSLLRRGARTAASQRQQRPTRTRKRPYYFGGVCSNGSFVYRSFSNSITSTTLPSGLRNGKGLPVYLCANGVHVLEVTVRTPLDHAATKLGFAVWVVKIDDGDGDTRIASGVFRFE